MLLFLGLRSHVHMPRKWRKQGGEEDRECDGRTALRGTWKEWEVNGEQQQTIQGDRYRSERNVRTETQRKSRR